MKTLEEIFGSFPDSGAVDSGVAKGVVRKVNILNEVRVVTLYADFSMLIPREKLHSAEKSIKILPMQ